MIDLLVLLMSVFRFHNSREVD